MAAGTVTSSSTDAINGSQLFSVANSGNVLGTSVANALGGGSAYTPGSGLTAPTYVISGTNYSNVGSALTALNSGLAGTTATAANSVQYDNPGHLIVTLGGAGSTVPVLLTNIAAGALAAGSTDAVNGGQLFTTNQQIAALAGGIANGSTGLVQQTGGSPGNGIITVGAQTGGTAVDFANSTSGTRTLKNITAGVANTDAVNVGQMNALATLTGNSFASALGGGSFFSLLTGLSAPSYMVGANSYNNVGGAISALNNGLTSVQATSANSVQYDNASHSSVTLGGTGSAPVTLTNVAAGTVTAGSTDAVNGGQLFTTNQQVTNLSNSIANGSIGLVQQTGGAPGTGVITVGSQTGGSVVSFANSSGASRVLSNVSNGVAASDAVNVGQLTAAVAANQYPLKSSVSSTFSGTVSGTNSLGVGSTANATANNTTAVGEGATASVANSVALGQGSVASKAATPVDSVTINGKVYVYAGATPTGTVSVGSAGKERQVQNVAAGQVNAASTDAVNGSQLYATQQATAEAAAKADNSVQYDRTASGAVNGVTYNPGGSAVVLHNVGNGTGANDAVNFSQLTNSMTSAVNQANGYTDTRINQVNFDLGNARRESNAGTAGALAAAGLPQAFEPGKSMIAGGFGIYHGQSAFAVGISKIMNDGHTVFKGGVTVDSRGRNGANAGVGYQF